MWSNGASKGRSSDDPGMMPLCGAHHRSIADQILGNTKARPSACKDGARDGHRLAAERLGAVLPLFDCK